LCCPSAAVGDEDGEEEAEEYGDDDGGGDDIDDGDGDGIHDDTDDGVGESLLLREGIAGAGDEDGGVVREEEGWYEAELPLSRVFLEFSLGCSLELSVSSGFTHPDLSIGSLPELFIVPSLLVLLSL